MSNNAAQTLGQEPEVPADIERQLQELIVALNQLVKRLRALVPAYTAPPYSPRRLLALIEDQWDRCTPELRTGGSERLKGIIGGDLFDSDTWSGLWYLVNYTTELQADIIKRRFTGEYETDDWGLDWELFESVIPFLTFLYEGYWRVATSGIENIPYEGRTLLVSNHSGQLPWDGAMIVTAVWNEHPSQRLVRSLYAPWFATVPILSALLMKMGHAVSTVENGRRLLEQEELVAVFPEGHAGMGKLYKERYQLASFGRGGFVKMALSTQSTIIPVSVVGAEEIYLSLAQSRTLARLTGLPYFTITPTFPWLGPLGLIPLPTKWYIDFGEPIPTEEYGPEAETNLLLIGQLKDRVRDTVQKMVNTRLADRGSVIRG
jgi:1-acyl-sn-glycerol-3-phosphate acyltransferase